jgi:hypothetical protein
MPIKLLIPKENEFAGSLKALLTRYNVTIIGAVRGNGIKTFMFVDSKFSGTNEFDIYLTMEEIIEYLKES